MKKIVLFLTICVLMCNLWVAAYAAEGQMQVNDLTAAPGQMLYLTIRLENAAQADTVGVQLAYDPTLLEMVEEACSWTQSGEIESFDAKRQAGVWTRNKQQDLNGSLCTIAFRVVEPNKTVSTHVDCTVILKVRSDEVGRFQDRISVSVTCEHQFGDWSYVDPDNHSQVCTVCQEQHLQSHQWGNGILGENPDRPGTNATFYTCQICNGEKMVEVESAPSTKPTEPANPAVPSDPAEQPSVPSASPQLPDQPKSGNTVLIVVIVVAAAALAAAIVVLWKKKK